MSSLQNTTLPLCFREVIRKFRVLQVAKIHEGYDGFVHHAAVEF